MIKDFRRLLQEFVRRFGLLAAEQTPCGIPLPTSDAHALMCLLEAGDQGIPQSTLVATLGVDKSTASRLVARMSERGHVSAASTDDGRARPVRLTQKGVRVARELEAASARRFAALLEGIPARRRTNVISALRDIVAALDRLHLDQGQRP